ncbi:MAG: acetyl-CoA carboxylase carboxyltransferase subunit alpha [Deltaproteobacteria bacterium]|nr:acetyl-CoA carboxylase carboxyltransferase subunit alpha [Deltaproteobacteria bacterium]
MEAFFDFEKPIILLEKKLEDLRELSRSESVDFSSEIRVLEAKLNALIDDLYSKLTPWQRVQLSRHPNRPYALDYIGLIFEEFTELHGDRLFGDDPSIVTGLAKLGEIPVAVVAQQKGRNTKQKIERNFGMARPEGYRKALRVMRLASQFGLPIVTFIDTPGAYPGLDAEERGQSEAIARCIMEMFALRTPVVACVIGEGGSGGALAIGVADRVLMQEYSTYSVISPESCASILWSDSSMNEKAARIMKMTPEDLKPLAVIDEIVPEPKGGAQRDWKSAAETLKSRLNFHVADLVKRSPDDLQSSRREKFRSMDGLTSAGPDDTASPERRKSKPRPS